MYTLTIIITKKMLLYERDFLWRNMSFEKYIRSHQGGFFMGKIFGTRFKMIVFDIWKI